MEGSVIVERNLHFDRTGLTALVVRLGWAQLEIFVDDVEKIQVMSAGDEGSVTDLRIEVRENELLVEQPQYGLSLNLMESKWMQVCIRVPRAWDKEMRIQTIGGLLSARGLRGSHLLLDTVSGDLRGVRLAADSIALKTISGDVRGEELEAKTLSVRSVSGSLVLDGISVDFLKGSSVSGEQTYNHTREFQQIEVNAVSGDVIITSPAQQINTAMRSVSGRMRAEGVTLVEQEGAPKVRFTGISADLKLIAISQ